MSGAGDVRSANPNRTGADLGPLYGSLLNTAGPTFSTEQQYKPGYLNLDLSLLGSALGGTGGTAGLLDLISRSRGSTVNDISNLAPGAASAFSALSPGSADLMNALNQQATEGLQAGSTLTPEQIYQATNPIQADYANRGLFNSDAARLAQGVSLATAGQGVQQQRQNFASGVAGLNQSQSAQLLPFLNNASAPLNAGLALTAGASPTLFNSDQAGSLLQSIYGAKNAAKQATAANTTGLYQSMDTNSNAFAGGL